MNVIVTLLETLQGHMTLNCGPSWSRALSRVLGGTCNDPMSRAGSGSDTGQHIARWRR